MSGSFRAQRRSARAGRRASAGAQIADGVAAKVRGALAAWHRLTIDFEGPYRGENPETFRDHRLDLLIRAVDGGESLIVPGYFAADGAAAETGARSGPIWRAHFTPPSEGRWRVDAQFRIGADAALDAAPARFPQGGFMHGAALTLDVAPSPTTAPDLRAMGPLTRVEGDPALGASGVYHFARSGGRRPRIWPEAPVELFAASAFFDDDPAGGDDNERPGFLRYASEWRAGDPLWGGRRAAGVDAPSRAVIGALNALARQGVTALALNPLRIARTGWACWPWSRRPRGARIEDDPQATFAFDVSRLDQWAAAIGHAQSLGLATHIVLDAGRAAETGRPPSLAERLWAREAVARFAAFNGVVWHAEGAPALSEAIAALDPYARPRVPNVGDQTPASPALYPEVDRPRGLRAGAAPRRPASPAAAAKDAAAKDAAAKAPDRAPGAAAPAPAASPEGVLPADTGRRLAEKLAAALAAPRTPAPKKTPAAARAQPVAEPPVSVEPPPPAPEEPSEEDPALASDAEAAAMSGEPDEDETDVEAMEAPQAADGEPSEADRDASGQNAAPSDSTLWARWADRLRPNRPAPAASAPRPPEPPVSGEPPMSGEPPRVHAQKAPRTEPPVETPKRRPSFGGVARAAAEAVAQRDAAASAATGGRRAFRRVMSDIAPADEALSDRSPADAPPPPVDARLVDGAEAPEAPPARARQTPARSTALDGVAMSAVASLRGEAPPGDGGPAERPAVEIDGLFREGVLDFAGFGGVQAPGAADATAEASTDAEPAPAAAPPPEKEQIGLFDAAAIGDGAPPPPAEPSLEDQLAAAAVASGEVPLELALYLFEPGPGSFNAEPVDMRKGLAPPEDPEQTVNLIARIAGPGAADVTAVALTIGEGPRRTEPLDGLAVFDNVGEALFEDVADAPFRMITLEALADGTAAKPLKRWRVAALPRRAAGPSRAEAAAAELAAYLSAARAAKAERGPAADPLAPESADDAEPPTVENDDDAFAPLDAAPEPAYLRALELIDADADRVAAAIRQNGVIVSAAYSGRATAFKATLAGAGAQRISLLKMTMAPLDREAAEEQVDEDRPTDLMGEKIGNFYRISLSPGRHRLAIEAYAAPDQPNDRPLLREEIEFTVR